MAQIEVYQDLLGDLPGPLLMTAAQRSLADHGICTLPPVGMIRKHARDLLDPPLEASQAWELVMKAVRRYGYDQGSAAIASLPHRVALAARAYGWRVICDTKPGIAFSQFCQVYDAIEGRARTEAAMPESVRLGAPKELAELREGVVKSLALKVAD